MHPKPAIIVFDVDGTLTKGFSWLRFHLIGGVTANEQTSWRNEYISGNLTYDDWLDRIITRYQHKKLHKYDFLNATEHVEYLTGTQTVLPELSKQIPLALASSGPDMFVEAVARELTVPRFYAACRFLFDGNGYFRTIAYDKPDKTAKVRFLKKLTIELDIKPTQIIYVGDSENDLEAFAYTQRGILVGNNDPVLRKASWKSISSLSQLPDLLML